MAQLKVCVVGSGAREHALQKKFVQDGADVTVTPGNPGIPGSVDIPVEKIDAGLFVFGSEGPLVAGKADELRAQGKSVFGPGADGAQIEGSKAFMKEVLVVAGVRTADYEVVTTEKAAQQALKNLTQLGYPGWAIKTDGLAAGKGVTVTNDFDTAMADVREKLGGKFGDAGRKLVIEGRLVGTVDKLPAREVSLFAVCNGINYRLLPTAQDYKLLNADSNENTGGMGAYSPTRDEDKLEEWAKLTVEPVIRELRRRGIDYRGVLYFGLMIVDGQVYVLEINIRLGDPETEVILPRITSNFVELCVDAAAGQAMAPVTTSDETVVGIVLAAAGYPDSNKIRTGDLIDTTALRLAEKAFGGEVFYAGVAAGKHPGELVTNGGRVLVAVVRHADPRQAVWWANYIAAISGRNCSWPSQIARFTLKLRLIPRA
jgi:phosphoribosylamine--glycine ligase